MASFPDRFVAEPEILRADFDGLGNQALERLALSGYEVAVGLSEYYAGAISIMSQQKLIAEYCPQDASCQRFASRASTERWLAKNGGRAVFLLLCQENPAADEPEHRLAGYAWTGLETPAGLAGYPITSAYRIGDEDRGKGLAGPFAQVVISATHARFAEGEGIGLEVWSSNHRAVSLYRELGFQALELAGRNSAEWRPTTDASAEDGLCRDKRLYMGYPAGRLAR